MTLIFRFVDQEGFLRECFFDLVNVKYTFTLNLKSEISTILAQHNLNT